MSQVNGLASNSAEISANYLNLLVTQLQNQNPLDPMDTNDMSMQLASLAQLSQVEQINSTFSQVLQLSRMGEGTGLIGRTVTFLDAGTGKQTEAEVASVQISSDKVELLAGPHTIGLDEVIEVH